ncbi:MAG: allophanate hydrolase subunit 1 [Pseudomonadota bacterium]
MTESPENVHVCDDWISRKLRDLSQIHRLAQLLREAGTWTEVVPGLDSVTVQFDPSRIDVGDAITALNSQLSVEGESSVSVSSTTDIPVCYDPDFAPDIANVAEQSGHSVENFIRWHQNVRFSVSMLGFLPGFAYLRCTEDGSDVRRLASPRQQVASGSVGMVGNQNCLYSFSSPGGWPIIGRTPVTLFDPAKSPPNLLQPDQIIRFKQIGRDDYERLVAKQQT